MSRDFRKLLVFREADALIPLVYRLTRCLPTEEQFGLQAQIRRAAVSAAANIVEGSSRPGSTEYCRFLRIAHGSARECAYLLGVGVRLGFLYETEISPLLGRYDTLQARLMAMVQALTSRQ